jgi:hypothetical protein
MSVAVASSLEEARGNAVQYPLDGFNCELQVFFEGLWISFAPLLSKQIMVSKMVPNAVSVRF